jgi:hypothetical protein
MKLRTELISEIRTLAVTFTAGDELREWIEDATDQDIQEVLGSRVRTIASAMSRLEIFMVDYGYDAALEAQEDEEDEEDEEDGVDPKRMAEKLKRARARYEPTVAYTGRLSSNTGDELSVFLAGMAPVDVCHLADLVCIDETGPIVMFHWNKYIHLNPGSIRMNAGNKIRSRVKAGLVSVPQLRDLLNQCPDYVIF